MQDVPTSDIDPYADNSSTNSSNITAQSEEQPQIYHINLDKLPRVFTPFPRPISGAAQNALGDHISTVESILKRPLTQPEVDALAYHFVNGMRITSLGGPVGFTAGLLAAYASREGGWQFPFWKPKENSRFNPNSFGPFKGAQAQRIWSFARWNAYGFTGTVFAMIFFGTYSVSVSGAGRATDQRLKDFNRDIQERIKQSGNTPMPPRQGQRSPIGTPAGNMDHQVERARGMLEQGRERNQQRAQQAAQQAQSRQLDDDMSPTSGSWMDDYKPASTDTGLLSDSQIQEQERRQRANADSSPTSNRDNTFDMNKVTSQPTNYDNPSPQASGRPLPAGSSWERLRKESQAQKQAPSQESRQGRTAGWGSVQREQQAGSTVGDSFSFSSTEEERQLAQAEAQNDFDARLERERQGGDFNQGRGKRW
ncbi:hypothetical protein MBLNU457_5402t1 [Dothideomycetes sp. NU457]